jgi:hypothetical protein
VNSPPSEKPESAASGRAAAARRHRSGCRSAADRAGGSPAHQRDRHRQQRAPAETIADQAEHHAANRTGRESEREHREGQQLLGGRARLRKELRADVAGEIAVDGEIEPLEDVADQTGKRRAQGD